MALIAYHASHEQFAPSHLLTLCQLAEDAGFKGINSSDHFHPWSERQGHSGFAFAWLGAAMQASKLPFSLVCAPGQRYHPAIVAQAIATLSEMFPGRFAAALGSGEAINENITGEKWPVKAERNERLAECISIIKRLLNGEEVTHQGHVIVEQAKLYTRPETPPLLLTAAVTKKTAEWAASRGDDGLLTVHKPYHELKEFIQAYRKAGGENKPAHLKVQVSYAKTKQEAMEGAYDQWRANVLPSTLLADLGHVAHFDAASELLKPEVLEESVIISSDPQVYIDHIKQYEDLGFDKIILHNVNRGQELFIQDFGAKVLPAFA